ncbi:uncharacterized protein PGTG_06439 [Puccinia graminis f. sp. tritici CRL 75-36-700-3]|uniref:Uncharacterized protein n=1 Tax=Puccinia graminis f. sp. tritici (strain CRL 75-36-700-3 / race SCCL) TaxID=418459 RepID=E3K7J2_PUCGT|nr:uncharacterized protein PGTG_06439 [Puccinia graminis f. sp. tritici CRL 75-36-700-3]EFP80483.1 hypothetical protein PGTG_06439 [Puccinia graminis f. sp. tritici CRL 75-36-700-3]
MYRRLFVDPRYQEGLSALALREHEGATDSQSGSWFWADVDSQFCRNLSSFEFFYKLEQPPSFAWVLRIRT